MKGLRFCAVMLAGALASATALAVAPPTCPAAGSATAGCNSTIIVNSDGSLTIATGPSPTGYDGSDDNLVGILNNSGHTINSIHLTGAGNGGGLFAFDLDGIDTFIPGSNATDTTGYGGPLAYFSNITNTNVFADTGDVNFINGGLLDGQSTYFSLESSAASTPIFSSTPEPSTFVLLGTGALGVAGSLRRRFMKR